MFDNTTDMIHCRLGSSTFLRRNSCQGILLRLITLMHYFARDVSTVLMFLRGDAFACAATRIIMGCGCGSCSVERSLMAHLHVLTAFRKSRKV